MNVSPLFNANLLEAPAHGPLETRTWLALTFDHRVRNRLANDRFNWEVHGNPVFQNTASDTGELILEQVHRPQNRETNFERSHLGTF